MEKLWLVNFSHGFGILNTFNYPWRWCVRLNESSMGKLFDLMIMGFKLQLMSVSPRDRGRGWSQGGEHIFGSATEEEVSKEKLGLYRGSNWQSGYEGLNHAKMSNPKQQVQLIQLPKTIPWYKANHSPGNLQLYVISDPVLYALNLQSHSAGDHWRHQQPPGRVAETRRSGSHEVTGGW